LARAAERPPRERIYTRAHTPLRRGFETFRGFWGGSEDYYSHSGGGGGGAYDFRRGEDVDHSAVGRYSTELFSAETVRVIEDHAPLSASLFVYLAYQATHAPLQAPETYVKRCAHVADASRRTFCAMALCMDEGVANITSALKRSGLYNTSLLFFTGDNGGQVRDGGNNWPLRGWKGSLFEGGVRASAFVHSPLLPPRTAYVWRGLVHVTDYFATACALAGLDCGPTDGIDVWHAIVANASSPRTELLHEIDPIALPRYHCSGPVAALNSEGKGNGTWSFPPIASGEDYRRAALRVGSLKLVIGSCAEWDCCDIGESEWPLLPYYARLPSSSPCFHVERRAPSLCIAQRTETGQ
jgi:arylsulfatase A-like enzyme